MVTSAEAGACPQAVAPGLTPYRLPGWKEPIIQVRGDLADELGVGPAAVHRLRDHGGSSGGPHDFFFPDSPSASAQT